MRLVRPKPPRAMISLVSMIDVLMILLIFFMVTSSYLDLKMLPMAESAESPGTAAAAGDASALLIRLGPDGRPRLRGQVLDPAALTAVLRTRLAGNAATSVIVLPSGQADAQALVGLMDTASRAGVLRMQILRLDARP